GAVTTIEFEPGLIEDLKGALQRLAPDDIDYAHNLRWQDGNGHSHIRAALIGPGLSIPFSQGRLMLGDWQQRVFLELDARPRQRRLILQIMGEYTAEQYQETVMTVGRPRLSSSIPERILLLPSRSTRVRFCKFHWPLI